MLGLPIAFTYPWLLLALLALPIIWYLLRLTPPKPQQEIFPPLVILEKLADRESTPAKSPWWLTLLRLALAALLIIALAQPVWKPQSSALTKTGPVLMVIDDGWASGQNWETIRKTAMAILTDAEEADRLVTLVIASDPFGVLQPNRPNEDLRSLLEGLANKPVKPDYLEVTRRIKQLQQQNTFGETLFLSSGMDMSGQAVDAIRALDTGTHEPMVFLPDTQDLVALSEIKNEPDRMRGTIQRANPSEALPVSLSALDINGLIIARTDLVMPTGQTSAQFEFRQPVELRNQIVSVKIDDKHNAGAVRLLDDSNRRRIVGLLSGQSADVSQPLLSPLYYINRALAPFSDIRQVDTANLHETVGELVNQNVSALVMPDIGTLDEETTQRLTQFVEKGGLLVRFAGPRLAANPASPLLPVELIEGDRIIGGALSWDEPQPLAAFETGSPYFGLDPPGEVLVKRQVLAEQTTLLDNATWARLEDGTPLVTARQQGSGWIVLFHVNSDNNWSNLPLSGSFVEMLRRTISLSRSNPTALSNQSEIRLPPLEVLNGTGNAIPPPIEVKPLSIASNNIARVSLENPPGLYGTIDGYVALNLLTRDEQLLRLNTTGLRGSVQGKTYLGDESLSLKPYLLLLALGLFLADCLAVLWFAGLLTPRARKTINKAALASLLMISILLTAVFSISVSSTEALAQETSGGGEANADLDFSATLETRFAYVKTGIDEVDRISAAGLLGLTRFIAARTALEPGDPIGIDIEDDELAFYPFLYWPIHLDAPVPHAQTMARIDAYMKQGGSVLFDTRNQLQQSLSNSSTSPQTIKLREILATLDIPSLEPVPPDHVLTKAFFLLDHFPGRYRDGELWVEQIARGEEIENRPVRAGDGVSSILITSNDFAAAWAIDDQNRSLFPLLPPDPALREYTFRVGVNIAMYTMTGNYKADQVHIPALLERLGQ